MSILKDSHKHSQSGDTVTCYAISVPLNTMLITVQHLSFVSSLTDMHCVFSLSVMPLQAQAGILITLSALWLVVTLSD